jgi:hypothetical protein
MQKIQQTTIRKLDGLSNEIILIFSMGGVSLAACKNSRK